jgi:hypothetical protein
VALARIVECLRRQLPEIRMGTHQTAQPAVFELLAPPGRRERIGLRPERLAAPRGRAVHIEQRAIGIEHDGIHRREAERHAHAVSEEVWRGQRDRCKRGSIEPAAAEPLLTGQRRFPDGLANRRDAVIAGDGEDLQCALGGRSGRPGVAAGSCYWQS